MVLADCGPQLHIAAYHSKDPGYYNNSTVGIGLLCEITPITTLAVGTFRNSYYRQTNYVAAVWQPVNIKGVRVGAITGLATGYNDNVVPLLGGVASIPVGPFAVHVVSLPPATMADAIASELSISWKFK